MVFIQKSIYLNLFKIFTKNFYKNVIIPKVMPLAFMSTKDSSKPLPLADLERLSKSNIKVNEINNICVSTTIPCESILAGNPQSIDRRDLIRHDIIKKWEQKTNKKPKTNPALFLAVTIFAEINKK